MGQRDEQGDSGPRERYARVAAHLVQRAWREGPARLVGSSGDAVSVVERTLRQRSRRLKAVRLTARVAAGGAVAAAAAGLILASRGSRGPEPGLVAQPAPPGAAATRQQPPAPPAPADPRALVVMSDGAPSWELAAGARVTAAGTTPLRIASAEGTALTLDPDSVLSAVEVGRVRRFALLRGAVHARVSKLGTGERFIVDTADAEVEVHGTAFRVEAAVPSPGCRARPPRRPGVARAADAQRLTTRVVVEEGVVSVRSGRHEERLHPGESWVAPCPASTHPGPRAQRPGPSRRGSAASADAASSLMEQNDLFSAAVAARKAGEPGRALALWERLIREYPGSSLLEGAMAGRMRVLAATDPERAAPVAGAYLARFPDGFARAEALALMRAAERP